MYNIERVHLHYLDIVYRGYARHLLLVYISQFMLEVMYMVWILMANGSHREPIR